MGLDEPLNVPLLWAPLCGANKRLINILFHFVNQKWAICFNDVLVKLCSTLANSVNWLVLSNAACAPMFHNNQISLAASLNCYILTFYQHYAMQKQYIRNLYNFTIFQLFDLTFFFWNFTFPLFKSISPFSKYIFSPFPKYFIPSGTDCALTITSARLTLPSHLTS